MLLSDGLAQAQFREDYMERKAVEDKKVFYEGELAQAQREVAGWTQRVLQLQGAINALTSVLSEAAPVEEVKE